MSRKGESINGYRLTTNLTNKECSTGKWAFAEKGGSVYFIKQFMAPKYPLPTAAGSAVTIRKKAERCEQFERDQRRLKDVLAKVAKGRGSVVETTDFFRVATFYYKVTPRIDVTSLSLEEISRLPIKDRLTLMLTAASSLAALHSQGVVHSDLKPANILVKRTDASYATRLIDFDGSYFESEPPSFDVVQGDFPYYSPELLKFVLTEGEAPRSLTTKSDVFAMGVVFTEYLCGQKPLFNPRRFRYVCEAISGGELPAWPSGRHDIPAAAKELVGQMLALAGHERPTMFSVLTRLQAINKHLGDAGPIGESESGKDTGAPKAMYPRRLKVGRRREPSRPETDERGVGAVRPRLRIGKWPMRGPE